MEILFVGEMSLVSNELFKSIDPSHQIIVYDNNKKSSLKGKDITVFPARKRMLEDLFESFSFGTVVYLSDSISTEYEYTENLKEIENVLRYSGENGVDHVIMITNNHFGSYIDHETDLKGLAIIQDTMEKMCQSASEQYEMSVQILKVPYIYKHTKISDSHPFFHQAVYDKKLVLPGSKEQQVDFLCETDLGEMLNRMIDELNPKTYQILHISGENATTLEELAYAIKVRIPDLEVEYQPYNDRLPVYHRGVAARKEFGYFAMDVLAERLHYMNPLKELSPSIRIRQYFRFTKYKKIHHIIRIVVEIIFFFWIAEMANLEVADNILLSFMDFRFVYVILIGVSEGLFPAIIASILACSGYVFDSLSDVPWQLLFYNVQNWIPFGAYFLGGGIAGYLTDKANDDVRFQKEEYDILVQKYNTLSSVYEEVKEGKEAFNRQILGYRDSYGKLYNAIKKLDSVLPEEVLYESVLVLEEMLGTNGVAIYTMQEGQYFARLAICSRSYTNKLKRSVNVLDYDYMMEPLSKQMMFVNTRALEDYPAYANPIFHNGKLLAGIMVMHADQSQMNMEFKNKFEIITALIRDSLISALDYQNANDEAVGDTAILKPEHFREVYAVKKEMKDNHLLEYLLLKISSDENDLAKLNDKLVEVTRTSDIIGMTEDASIYLLLSQATRQDMGMIGRRLLDHGLRYKIVEDIE